MTPIKRQKRTQTPQNTNPVNFKQEYYLQYFFRFNETHFKKSGAKSVKWWKLESCVIYKFVYVCAFK